MRGHWSIAWILIVVGLLTLGSALAASFGKNIAGASGSSTAGPVTGESPFLSPARLTVAELRAAPTVPVLDQESGLNLGDGTYIGPADLVSAVDPLGTTAILVSLAPSNGSALEALLQELSNPASPGYRHYLTHAEFNAEFGSSPAVYESLVSYLRTFNVTLLTTHPDRLMIGFQATPPQISSIFHTYLGAFLTPAGDPYFAPLSTPELPSILSPDINEVQGLSNYSEYLNHPDSTVVTEKLLSSAAGAVASQSRLDTADSPGGGLDPFPSTTVGGLTYDEPVHLGTAGSNCETSTCGQMMEGADLQVAYNESGLFAKYGYPVNATVAAMLWTDPVCTSNTSTCKSNGFYNTFCGTLTPGQDAWDFFMPDVTSYWNYTLPNGEPMPRAVSLPVTGYSYSYPAGSEGLSASCDDAEAEGENTLDVAMEGSMLPGANIFQVFGGSATTAELTTELSDILSPTTSLFSATGGFDTAANIADLSNVSVIANSWGGSGSLGSTWTNEWKEAQTLGITIVASSGDAGTSSLESPAENAYNAYGTVAVGGTTLVVNATTLLRTPAALFSNSAPYDGTGGGEIVWYEPAGTVAGFSSTYGSIGGVTTATTNYAPIWQNSSADAHGIIKRILSADGRGEPDIAAIANDTIVDVNIGYFSANITCLVSSSCTRISAVGGATVIEHGWTYFIGTSISDQVEGGLITMTDYALHRVGEGRVGFIDPATYSAGQLEVAGDLTLHSFYPITLYHNAESSTTFGAFSNGSWDAADGWGSIDSGNFTQNTLTYPVTFSETGLPTSTSWSVTLTPTVGDAGCTVTGSMCADSVTSSSSTSVISFGEPYGTYEFVINAVGYSPVPPSGSVSVDGAASPVAIHFTELTYAVTFSETGLPTGTSWGVTLGSTFESSTESSIPFEEPSGTYSFNVSGVAGYSSSPSSGSVIVSGSALPVGLSFAQTTYTLTISESELPSSLTFEVTVGASTEHVTTDGGTDTVSFAEPNGSYEYSIAYVEGWQESTIAYAGEFVVLGAPVTEPVLEYTPLAPQLTISTTSGSVGTVVVATGSGFASNSAVALKFDGEPVPSNCSTGPRGNFPGVTGTPCTFSVPTSAPVGDDGGSNVLATTGLSFIASASFSVAPLQVTIDATSGSIGTVVTATGSGFAPDSEVTLTFDGGSVASNCSTGPHGYFPGVTGTPCTFVVPTSASVGDDGGSNVVAATGPSFEASTSFSVAPLELMLAVTSGSPGSIVMATGSGFLPNSAVTFSFDGTIVASNCSTGSHGYFPGVTGTPCTFAVPTSTPVGDDGASNVVAATGPSFEASTSFSVAPLQLTLAGSSGSPGSIVTATGSGFLPDSAVTFSFDGSIVASNCSTGPHGYFPGVTGTPCAIVVPDSAPAGSEGGSNVVAKTGSSYSAATTFAVTILQLTIDPTSGPTGTLVTATGSGFIVDSTVDFTFDGEEVASNCSTGAHGYFPGSTGTPCTFVVPTSAPVGDDGGSNVVAATGLSSTASGSFSVTVLQPAAARAFELPERGSASMTRASTNVSGIEDWVELAALPVASIEFSRCFGAALAVPRAGGLPSVAPGG